MRSINLLFSGILLFCVNAIYGQDSTLAFLEVVQRDSVILFYNSRYHLVEKECAVNTRRVRFDNDGQFNGHFVDFDSTNSIFGTGNYIHGIRNGMFEEFYHTQQLKSKGRFLNGIPVGDWYYFYPNGIQEKIVRVNGTDTLLITWNDTEGNGKVIDGNGDFEGSLNTNSNILVNGKVLGGKPDGKWTSYMHKQVYCNEEFLEGKFIKGKFPNAKFAKEQDYTNKSFLNSFLTKSYLDELETFHVEKCKDPLQYKEMPGEMKGANMFYSEIKYRINDLIKDAFKYERLNSDNVGDMKFSIKFSTDQNGNPEKFVSLIGMFDELEDAVVSSIKKHMTFPRNQKELYFHMIFHFSGGGTFTYNSAFSKQSTYSNY